ncbi:hypothetical protein MMC10_004201 [Thelotrema lepadinum]|nr:hypothetical protein [Thelotrema lepadinum]
MAPRAPLAHSPAKANSIVKAEENTKVCVSSTLTLPQPFFYWLAHQPKTSKQTAKSSKAQVGNQAPTEQKTTKKRKSTESDTAPVTKKAKSTASTTKESGNKVKDVKKDSGLVDISDVHLDGENNDAVPMYETPADVRRHMTTFFDNSKVSQKAFVEAISAASNTACSVSQLSTFRKKGGKRGSTSVDGADSRVFYAAWVYFEKIRIKNGDKKNAHRMQMEKIWGDKGKERIGNKPLILHSSETARYDKFGQLSINGKLCK